MISEAELQEYLDEIRQEVCSRCVERPSGGPPCNSLGKPCGVEMHLPQLVESVHQVHSGLITPYLDTNRQDICQRCPFLHGDFCPCPMDSLAVLVVQAIETVDERHARRDRGRKLAAGLPGRDRPDLEEILRAYEAAAGTWIGCDWPTVFGPGGLNLEGWTATEAEAYAVEVAREERMDWAAAAGWLAEVERKAEEAEAEAEQALRAANAGAWREAAGHAGRAWTLEFATGRPLRRQPATWQRLYEVLKAAELAHDDSETVAAAGFGTRAR